MIRVGVVLFVMMMMAAGACSDNADDLGVGAQCASNDQCSSDPKQQTCLAFKGGYCGISGCTHDSDCPESSACIAHTDGTNYCFRTCADKPDCNANRDAENESNC